MRTFVSAFGKTDSKHTRGAVVQLVRMPACHAGGREFESRPHRLTQPIGLFSAKTEYNKKQGSVSSTE